MRSVLGATIVVNGLILLETTVAFRLWMVDQYGYVKPDVCAMARCP